MTFRARPCIAVVVAALMTCALASAGIAQPASTPPAPLRIGVGGDYPSGLDGLLTSRGMPHERVFPWELADSAVLEGFDVLLLSCPMSTRGALDPALTQWLSAGGRAYVEVWAGLQGPAPLPRLVSVRGRVPNETDALLSAADHPILRGLDREPPIDLFHLQGMLLSPRQPEQTTDLAQFCTGDRKFVLSQGVAAVHLPVGEGELIYCGAPLSFVLFHRGPTTEPLLTACIDYLCREQAISRFSPAAFDRADEEAEVLSDQTSEQAPADSAVLPEGFELLEEVSAGAYNVTARLEPAQEGALAILLLDGDFTAAGEAGRDCLWLTAARGRIELRVGKGPDGAVVGAAPWVTSDRPVQLTVQRRDHLVFLSLDGQRVLRASTSVAPGGLLALSHGDGALTDVTCQPVGEVVFSDDFMRDRGDPDPWTRRSGSWRTMGLPNSGQSVNGFYLRGASDQTALTTTGADWWESYTCSVAVRAKAAATVGLCALVRGDKDFVAFTADCAENPEALRLVNVTGGAETVLATAAGTLAPGQWYRLGLRVAGDTLEGLVDGEVAISSPYRAQQGGEIGLLLRGGRADFDDVLVRPSDVPLQAPRNEGSPVPDVPATLGPQDSLTWANPAMQWGASPQRPSLLWHTGSFSREVAAGVRLAPVSAPALRRLILAPDTDAPEPEWLAVTTLLRPDVSGAELLIAQPGEAPVAKQVMLDGGAELALRRTDEAVEVLWNGTSVARLPPRAALRRLGLEIDGISLPADAVEVYAPGVRDYVFGVAPTDWWVSAGTWEVASRWACDRRWSWYAGWGEGDLAIWNKRPVEGDVVLEYWVGLKMEAPGGPEITRCRDLNAVLCGDKSDPRSGYSFILGGDGGVKTQLLRNGAVVAEAPEVRVPAGYGVHHEWFRVRVAKMGSRIEMDFEGRPVFRYEDPEPLPGGYVGIWSRRNGIMVPRVTVYR